VALQLDAVSDCRSMSRLRDTLSSLPRTLDETYRRILDQINEYDQSRVHHILQCICFCRRHLSVDEVAHIYRIGDQLNSPFEAEDALFHSADVVNLCHGLLCIAVAQGYLQSEQYFGVRKIEIVQVAHFSVREYLLSSRAMSWRLEAESSHLYIIKLAIAYYLACTSSSDVTQYSWGRLRRKHSPVIYTTEYLSQHLSALNPREHPDLIPCFQHLLDPTSSTRNHIVGMAFWHYRCGMPAVGPIPPLEVSTLHIAANLGLPITCQWLLSLNPLSRIESLKILHGIQTSFLVEVAETGCAELIKVLLHAGADIDQQDEDGRTALYTASQVGRVDAVRVLLDANACVEGNSSRYPDSPTPLHIAARCGHTMIVQMLIDAGAEVDGGISHVEHSTSTPLQLALEASHWHAIEERMIQALVKAGANVRAESEKLAPPLVIAVERRLKNNVQILLDVPGVDVNQKPTSPGYWPPLHTAVRKGDSEIVEMLVNAGADVNMAVAGDCPTPLHIAARWGHTTIAQMLIDAGAKVDGSPSCITDDISTPLQLALARSDGALFRAEDPMILASSLLKAGANINAGSTKLGPPLVLAVEHRSKNSIQILLDVPGLDVNHKPTSPGCLPALHTAVQKGNSEIVEMLVNAGADVNMAVGEEYPTPLHIAARWGHTTIVQMLIDSGAEVDGSPSCITDSTSTPLQLALAGLGRALFRVEDQMILALLKAGANVNAGSTKLGPPLVLAVEKRSKPFIRMILDMPGVDVNQKPTSLGYFPPLHTAVRRRDSEIVEMLVSAGADVNMIFNGWGTPLDLAIIRQCQADILKILRDAGGRRSH
jgi:ankyrin repeat protein